MQIWDDLKCQNLLIFASTFLTSTQDRWHNYNFDTMDNNNWKITLKSNQIDFSLLISTIQFVQIKFHQIDLANMDTLNKNSHIFENCEAVVHLGARAGVRQSFDDPEKYLMDNTLGTTNLSLKVKEYDVPQILIASTSSIYGDTGKQLAVENKDELFNPPSVYASTKSFGETLAKNILEDTSTAVKIARFFTVYGPFGRPDMSILRFIHWIASGQDVIIYGDGNQRRSFTYISDIVDGIQKLLKYKKEGTFNFGSNQTWSLNEVIELIEKHIEKKGKIINK